MRTLGSRHRALRDGLRGIFAKAKMPSNPALVSRILALINDSKSSAADFGAAIRADAALCSRLLKAANCALFAQRNPVTTIERAVTVLGLDRVKTVSLGFQLVTCLERLGGAPFDMKAFWQHSLLRACIARSIAHTAVPGRKEEAFLIGLLQDCGVPLLVQVLGCGYARLYRSKLSPTAFYKVERESFPHTHVDAITAMAAEWKLPKVIAVPLQLHHRRAQLPEQASDIDCLSAVGYFVGGLCFSDDLAMVPEDQELREFGTTALKLDQAEWDRARSRAAEEFQRVSALFWDVLAEDVDVTELLGEANHQLASAASSAAQRMLDVSAERDAIHREQQRLQNALREYRERAALDPLTNIMNRGALTQAARQAIERSADQYDGVGVLFIDLDNFKQLNDTHGHKVGDRVLQAVAGVLGEEVRRSGTVGRYGGEEFVVVLQGSPAQTSREIAARVVARVRNLETSALGFSGKVTCSVGAIWCECSPVDSAEELFAAADQLMYEAKRSGKDRCCFKQLPMPDRSAGPVGGGEGDRAASPGTAEDGVDGAQLDTLLAIAQRLNTKETGTFVGIRKQERKRLVAPCILHYFTGAGAEMGSEQAAARNISSGGIGIMVSRTLIRGEPVEIVLSAGASQQFLAGLVAFCRHIEGSIHELGVQFVIHSVTPVIVGDT
ncbi:MAG: sensor domain-containing diguanylate cyclase, partial [Planctomycetota bacterium]